VNIISYTSRKLYALREACTIWEGIFIYRNKCLTSTNIPLGTAIHNIEMTLGKGGQLSRVEGVVAELIAKENRSATLRLPSGEFRLISENCSATIGQVGNITANNRSFNKFGAKIWLAKRSEVRGVAMNPVDHPHGGGEGRTLIGRKKPVSP
jgi:large subunit ribosomal protein L2